MAVDEAQAPQEWYCDQCGRRYAGPGVCDNEHPPSELKPLAAAASDATDEAATSTGGDEPADATGSSTAAEQEAGHMGGASVADVSPASDSSSVLQKAKDALDRAAQAVADAASLVAAKIEE